MTDLFPTKANDTLRARETYTVSSFADATYRSGLTGSGSTSVALKTRTRYPVGCDPTAPRPLFIYLIGGGYETSDETNGVAFADEFVARGFVCSSAEYRVEPDTPWSDHAGAGDTVKSKAIRAAIEDINELVSWWKKPEQRRTANYTIDPRGIFIFGTSAGAQLATMYGMEHQADPVAGIIHTRGGLGLDHASFPATATADLRAFHTEADWVNGITPTCAFLGGADDVVGITYSVALKDKFLLGAENTVFYDVTAGHDDAEVADAYGVPDPYQEMYDFSNDIWAALPQRGSKLAIT